MRRFRDDERGVVAPMAALLVVMLVGISALVLDFGTIYASRRALQNTADAAALAGARAIETQFLSGVGDPAGDALAWARKNGSTANGTTCTTDGKPSVTYNAPDPARPNSWRVATSRLVRLNFGPVIGVQSMCVTANAVAVVTSASVAKLFPWSLYGNVQVSPFAKPGTAQSCDPNDVANNPYCFVLKEGSDGSAAGNFGILNFPCGGSSSQKVDNYVYWAKYGYGSRSGETIPGPIPTNEWVVCTFTGNTATGNSEIANWIIANTTNPPPTCPKGRNDPNYVPDFRCPLIGLLPILKESSLGSGSSGTVTIIKFAIFELVGLTQDKNGTGHQQIVGQFLQWAAAVGPTQPQDPSGQLSGALTIRLVQ
ncbi:MAG: pilus assembly protein TadG-related protein [Chloroflexota bacterium]|nr:pilus assembly protein TadG-related protein [Chloroflexota bacterium]